jgi:hypothetical protein
MDSFSRNGHGARRAPARTVVQAQPVTAYEAAIAAATDTEQERLKAIRLQFDIPPNSPEWGFYAVLAPLVATRTGSDKTLEAIGERLERLQQSVDERHSLFLRVRVRRRRLRAGLRCRRLWLALRSDLRPRRDVLPRPDRSSHRAVVALAPPAGQYLGRATWVTGPPRSKRQTTRARWHSGSRS